MSTKMAILDLLKMNVFGNKDFDIINLVNDVTNKILSRDSKTLQTRSCDQSLVTLAFL